MSSTAGGRCRYFGNDRRLFWRFPPQREGLNTKIANRAW